MTFIEDKVAEFQEKYGAFEFCARVDQFTHDRLTDYLRLTLEAAAACGDKEGFERGRRQGIAEGEVRYMNRLMGHGSFVTHTITNQAGEPEVVKTWMLSEVELKEALTALQKDKEN